MGTKVLGGLCVAVLVSVFAGCEAPSGGPGKFDLDNGVEVTVQRSRWCAKDVSFPLGSQAIVINKEWDYQNDFTVVNRGEKVVTLKVTISRWNGGYAALKETSEEIELHPGQEIKSSAPSGTTVRMVVIPPKQ